MKEQYTKPVIIFESFSLTQTIARDCGYSGHSTLGEPTYYSELNCAWDCGGYTVYLLYLDKGCEDDGPETPEEAEEFSFEGQCYNNPDGGTEIFSSM